MPKRKLDRETRFTGDKQLPDQQKIEKAEVEEVLAEGWPTEPVEKEPYLADESLVEAVNLAIALGRPLLLQGDPGCGKTCLAYAVAYELGCPLEVAYVKSTSRTRDLLYAYDAVKRLYDAQISPHMSEDERNQVQVRDVTRYIRLGPLGRAVARSGCGRRSVVLIDEIDKADIDFPNDLLWELDRLEFKVDEAPEMMFKASDDPKHRPLVVITHNEEKALPAAFLRRCIYHYVSFPENRELLERILAMHCPEVETLHGMAIDTLLKLREKDLLKKPGLSELIDWMGYAWINDANAEDIDRLRYAGALIKHEEDRKRITRDSRKDER